jgi:acetyl esterase/lipase
MDLVIYLGGVIGVVLVANGMRPPGSASRPFPPAWLPAMLVAELAPLFALGTGAVLVLALLGGVQDSTPGRVGVWLLAATLAGLAWLAIRNRSGARNLAATHDIERSGSLIGRQRPPESVEIVSHEYAPGLTLDLVRLADLREAAPCFVWVHGGGWTGGNPYAAGRTLIYGLAKRGWAVAAIRYPLSPEATHPEHVDGVVAAVRWLQERAPDLALDPVRLALGGASAGAHLSALAALMTSNGDHSTMAPIRGCLALYGIYDFLNRHSTRRNWPVIPRAVMKQPIADTPAYRWASPIEHVHAGAPPFLVVHGSSDSLVRAKESTTFVDALTDRSESTVEYLEVPGAQHAFDAIASARTRAATSRMIDFLERAVSLQKGTG